MVQKLRVPMGFAIAAAVLYLAEPTLVSILVLTRSGFRRAFSRSRGRRDQKGLDARHLRGVRAHT